MPLNAQLIAGTLNISGQGTLSRSHTPADAMTVPIAGGLGFTLISPVV